jgi:hypothetical protein
VTVTAPTPPPAPPITVTVSPSSATVVAGSTAQLTATVTGSTDGVVSWSVAEGSAGGSVSGTGLYSAPSTPGTYHVVATSHADASCSATATVTVTAPPPAPIAVTVTPKTASVVAAGTVQLGATVTGSTDAAVTWSVQEGAAGGTVSASGLYTAPTAAGTYHAVAASHADPSKTAVSTITVTAPPPAPVAIAIAPSTTTVVGGNTVQLQATVTGSTDTAATWSVQEGTAGGSVSASGLYTAPQTAGTYHVVAASHADPSKTAVSTVTVTAPAPSDSVDVRSYGAVGDGVTDDTAAFKRAAAVKKTLLIPKTAAHYKLTSVVRVYASVQGVNSPEIRMYGADGSDAKSMFSVEDYAGPGLVISGLHLNGQYDGVGTVAEHSHNISVRGSSNVTVENNILELPYGDNVYIGSGATSHAQSKNIMVQGNTMSGPRRCNVAVISVNGMVIRNNSIDKANDYVSAIDLEPNGNTYDLVQNVEISSNDFNVPVGIAVNLFSQSMSVPSGGVTVSGNTAHASRFFFKPNNTGTWQDVTVTNNTYLGNGGAVALNSFALVVQDASFAPRIAKNFTFQGNHITAWSGSKTGDYFAGVQGLQLLNNVWSGPSAYVVGVSACPSAVVTGNTYTGVGHYVSP